MEIQQLLKIKELEIKKPKINSERADILSQIVEEINKERPYTYKVGDKKKTVNKIKPRAVAIKVSHIPTKDLYYILSQGKDYKNRQGSFNKYFFGSIKVNK